MDVVRQMACFYAVCLYASTLMMMTLTMADCNWIVLTHSESCQRDWLNLFNVWDQPSLWVMISLPVSRCISLFSMIGTFKVDKSLLNLTSRRASLYQQQKFTTGMSKLKGKKLNTSESFTRYRPSVNKGDLDISRLSSMTILPSPADSQQYLNIISDAWKMQKTGRYIYVCIFCHIQHRIYANAIFI